MDIIKHRKKLAHDKHFDGDMPKSEYDEYVTLVNQDLDKLKLKMRQYDEPLQDNTLAFSELKESLDEFLLFNELTPEILHRLIDRIEIKADGSPRIFYRFSNPSAYSLLLTINAQHSTCVVW
jgi:site-specific DNA recombinase